jgi:Fe-S cluster assembly iron-binding protein IscA
VFTITDKAAEMALFCIAQEGKQGWGLKIFLEGEGCGAYQMGLLEEPAEGDQVFEKNGLRVFLDKECSGMLADMELDFNGKGFTFNGGEESSCGGSCSGCSGCG